MMSPARPQDAHLPLSTRRPALTLKLDPGSKEAHDQWQEGLMMAIAGAQAGSH